MIANHQVGAAALIVFSQSSCFSLNYLITKHVVVFLHLTYMLCCYNRCLNWTFFPNLSSCPYPVTNILTFHALLIYSFNAQ